MSLFFEKIQKIGLFLGCFYAFFRVFKPKNTDSKTGLSAFGGILIPKSKIGN